MDRVVGFTDGNMTLMPAEVKSQSQEVSDEFS